MRRLYLLPVFVGFVMSFISSRYLFVGSGLSLIPWGILSLLFGVMARSMSEATRLGAIYGFSQAFIFLWLDKAGNTPSGQFLTLFAIISGLGILAGGCAAVAARLSYVVKKTTGNSP
jgi:hypothetical protein